MVAKVGPRVALAALLSSAWGVGCGPRNAGPTTCPDPSASTSAAVEPAADPLADIDERVERVMQALSVPGLSIAIVKDDEVVVAKGYGVLEQGKDAAVDEHTVFAIASNTKAFTATLVGMLAAEGALSWDDHVRQHLPTLQTWDEATTAELRVRDLVTHRSGLETWAGDLAWIGSSIDAPTLLTKLPHVKGSTGLRSRYGYSNLMFAVAGAVIEAVSGKSWAEQVKARLLEPLGMERTTVSVSDLSGQDNVAAPHMPATEDEGAPLIVVPYLDVDAAAPAAALNSSAADMARWLRAQLAEGRLGDQPVIPPEIVEDLWTPQTVFPAPIGAMRPTQHFLLVGSGWFTYDYGGRRVVTHSGGLPGMTSRVVLVPEERLGVVVLTNSETSAATFLGYEVVDAVLEQGPYDYVAMAKERKAAAAEPEAQSAEGAPTEAALKPEAYAGRYREALLGRAEVEAADGALRLTLPDHGGLSCPLAHHDGEVFDCVWSDPIFGRSEVAFEVEGRKAKGLRFRVRPAFIDPLEYHFTVSRK